MDDACFTRYRSAETGTRVGRADQWVERSTLESRAFLWMPVTISRLQRLTRNILLAGVDCWGASAGGFERGSILLGVHHPDTANSWKVRRGVIVARGGRIVHMKVAPVVATHQSSQSQAPWAVLVCALTSAHSAQSWPGSGSGGLESFKEAGERQRVSELKESWSRLSQLKSAEGQR